MKAIISNSGEYYLTLPVQVHKQKHPTHALDAQVALKFPRKTSQPYDTMVQNLCPDPCETLWAQIKSSTQSAVFIQYKKNHSQVQTC